MFRTFRICLFFILLAVVAAGCDKSERPRHAAEKPAGEAADEPSALTWSNIRTEGDALLTRRDYLGAIAKYRSATPEMRRAEGVEREIADAIYNVREIANKDSKAEIKTVDALIGQGKFAEANSLLAELEERFPEVEFPYEARRNRKKCRECARAEEEWRTVIFAIGENDKEKDITRKYGIKFNKENTLTDNANVANYYKLSDGRLHVVLNSDKKSDVDKITFTFEVPMKPRDSSDFAGLEFYIEPPDGAKVIVDVLCHDIFYQKTLDDPHGSIFIPFDQPDGFKRLEGIELERKKINSVLIHVSFDRDTGEGKTYDVFIDDIRLSGQSD